MAQLIEHSGVIKDIQNNLIQVLIVQNSACSNCDAKSACTVSEHADKIINIERSDLSFEVGEKVILLGRQSIALYAVLLAFVLPFILILTTLIILESFAVNETTSGIVSVLTLVPYYVILSFFNIRLKRNLKFEIRKYNIE